MRHDAIVRRLGRDLQERGWSVLYEKSYDTAVGLRKPDITARRGATIAIVDAQVVGDSDVNRAHRAKISKYKDEAHLAAVIADDFAQSRRDNDPRDLTVVFCSATLTYRGVWSDQALASLTPLGVRAPTLSAITTMALWGSFMNWRRFNTMTTVRNHRH